MKELKAELLSVLVIFILTLISYYLTDHYIIILSIGLVAYLSWHLFQLQRFYTLFINNRKFSLTAPSGLWGLLYKSLDDRQNRWQHYRHNKRRIFSRFQQAFKHFPYGVIILDNTWKISWYNHSSRKFFAKNTTIIQSDIHLLINHPVLNEYTAAGDFSNPLEIQSPIDKASILSLQFITLSAITLSDKEQETLLIIRDITSSFHLDQTRKDFIANVTHELKTPLTVFNGFLEPMCEDINDIPQPWANSIELMYQQSLRMNDIINELLLLSKLEISATIASMEIINMPELIKESIHNAELLTGENTHKISFDIQDRLNLKGDSEIIKMVINNLLVNAIKYTPQYSKIKITWYSRSDKPCLIVNDSGEGIATRHLTRLTERFYRVESGRSREQGGTGLGLAIVNHALIRHQAELKISSEIGHGSTFSCIFPEKRISA